MKKVLVVEDNKDNMRLITYALQKVGYEVIPAETGEEGVELAIRERPFFIIMDINLPGIDGLEATRRIRASEADGSVPIIAITSYAMFGDRDRVLQAGCTAYFEKPIDPLTIVERIHKAIGVKCE
ncbi:response regulator [Geotalea uraniireducens]|uniref:Response regulator receiver protein n=1 Tax=Geotalea uraniireducens (strain Rf4) TaxID=351605 RepID=A5GE91_GEOUR|nr:response regulator [Geotalea uraniireducens]ABQ25746.1 response regulator receiver protein [Geotalea uraniireducens Rf4]